MLSLRLFLPRITVTTGCRITITTIVEVVGTGSRITVTTIVEVVGTGSRMTITMMRVGIGVVVVIWIITTTTATIGVASVDSVLASAWALA